MSGAPQTVRTSTPKRQRCSSSGVKEGNIYTDRGLSGRNRDWPSLKSGARSGACRRHPRRPEARPPRKVGARCQSDRSPSRSEGLWTTPGDPMGKMCFNILATLAGSKVYLARARTREGMVVDRSKGRLKQRQPKLTPLQVAEYGRFTLPGSTPSANSEEFLACLGQRSTALSTERHRKCPRSSGN